MALLKRHQSGSKSRALNGVIRRAADAITNLAHENANVKTCVRCSFCIFSFKSYSNYHVFILILLLTFRVEGGIQPLVELLEFVDAKVRRAASGALRTLAFKNDENKKQVDFFCYIIMYRCSYVSCIIWNAIFQIVECNALPTLILMLRSEDATLHYEAVGSHPRFYIFRFSLVTSFSF